MKFVYDDTTMHESPKIAIVKRNLQFDIRK